MSHLLWRLSWWRRKRQIHSRQEAAEEENLRRGDRATTKMCRECRALIPAGAGRCPECGASTAHIRSGGLGRRVSRVLPFEMTATMMLISSWFVMFILGTILTMTLAPRGGAESPTPLQAIMSLDWRALLMTGANEGHLSSGPEPWRLLTAIFVHAGIIHIGFNTMAMVWIGQLVEGIYGSSRMFVLFILTGVAGNVVSLWWNGLMWRQMGASGAIFGLVGVTAVYAYANSDRLAQALRGMVVRIVMWAVLLSFIPHIDNVAHFGGMLSGAALAWILPSPSSTPGAPAERLWRIAAWILAVLCAAALAFTFVRWAILT